MRARALVLAALALMTAVPTASAGGTTIGCGGFAPFQTSCRAGGLVWTGELGYEARVFAFVGGMEVAMVYEPPSGGEVRTGVRCTLVAVGPLGGCVSFTEPEGAQIPVGAQVALECRVHGAQVPEEGTPVQATVGPVGPWGCAVHQD